MRPSHTGIRLKITVAQPDGPQTILEGDSDWLHMNAILSEYLGATGHAVEHQWHEIAQLIGGPIQIWIQPCMLGEDYPDDEGQADDD